MTIPQTWSDHSVYRFAVPRGEDDLQVRMRATQAAPRFTSNLIGARVPRKPEQGPDDFFREPNRGAAQDPSHRVLRSGKGTRDGHQACWQDVTFFSPEAGLQIYQRQIALLFADYAVVLTLTSDRDDLEKTAAAAVLLLDS